MITTTGRYWSTGITVTHQQHAGHTDGQPHSGWGAKLDYCDDGFADDDPENGFVSTEGTLHTRYAVRDAKTRTGLSIAIDNLLADAKRLGIEFTKFGLGPGPFLYYRGDGEDADFPLPDGWRETLAAETERIGFVSYQTTAAQA